MIAFLGMGLLGSNFVKALLKKGEEVQVWNRTYAKSRDLEPLGAQCFSSAADAVAGADRVHLTLKDDASVQEVLEAAAKGLKPGAIIIDHTTTSREGAIERTEYWKGKGFLYQHAPVFMGPSNALGSTGYMMVSGDQLLIARLTPQLSKMTGQLINFGPEPGKAAAMKLAGNAFLVCFTAGIRETLLLSKALEVSTTELTELFNHWNPGALLTARLSRMTQPDHSSPSWELAMARKDTGLFLEAAKDAGIDLALMPSIASVMDHWIQAGFGGHDWTVIARDAN